jgi:hypothetical protein
MQHVIPSIDRVLGEPFEPKARQPERRTYCVEVGPNRRRRGIEGLLDVGCFCLVHSNGTQHCGWIDD